MPLKFLRLPQLIQSEIIDNLMPEEIFLLSLCSQRSFKILQSNFRKSPKLNITVNVSCSLRAGYNLNGQRGQFIRLVKIPSIYGRSSPESVTICGERTLIRHNPFENIWEAEWSLDCSNAKFVIDHVSSLFQRNVHHIELDYYRAATVNNIFWPTIGPPNPLFGSSYSSMIQTAHLNENQSIQSTSGLNFFSGYPIFPHTSISYHPLNHQQLNHPANARSSTTQSPNSDQSRSNFSKIVSWDTVDHLDTNVAIPTYILKEVRKTVWLKDASFVTLDDLMSMDQTEIYMDNSKLKNEDINNFLKNWLQNKGNQRIRQLYCQLEELAVSGIIRRGLLQSTLERDEIREYTSLRSADELLELPARPYFGFGRDFELQRSDGATVAGKCDYYKVTLVFYPPKSESKQRQTTRKRTMPTTESMSFDYYS